MPPDPQAPGPQDATPKEPQKQAPPPATPLPPVTPARTPGQLDIDEILLPQKEVRKVESARRVSAGALLDQEIKAGTEGIQNPSQPPRAPAPPKEKKPETEAIEPLQTYQADIEKVMRGADVSIVSIAAAEAQRRAQMGGQQVLPETSPASLQERAVAFIRQFAMVGLGATFLFIALGIIGYLLLRPTTVPVAQAPASPFIGVDATEAVSHQPGEPARNFMTRLAQTKQKVSLALGLIDRIIPTDASTTADGLQTLTPMSAQSFLLALVPLDMPDQLVRTLEPEYLLGIHVYDANQALLILRVDSYQDGFSGMLSWEKTMQNDLAPLFTYTPAPRIRPTAPPPPPGIPQVQGGISSGTPTSTPATTTPVTQTPSKPLYTSPPNFADRIVENHDARVLLNQDGDIVMLWTFLDRNTLLITTNAATLREVISRQKESPVTAIPSQ